MSIVVESKFVVEIVYNGITKAVEVEPEEQVTALLRKAIAAFGITQNAHLLSLSTGWMATWCRTTSRSNALVSNAASSFSCARIRLKVELGCCVFVRTLWTGRFERFEPVEKDGTNVWCTGQVQLRSQSWMESSIPSTSGRPSATSLMISG